MDRIVLYRKTRGEGKRVGRGMGGRGVLNQRMDMLSFITNCVKGEKEKIK